VEEISPDLIDAVDPIAAAMMSLPGVTGVGLGFREEDGELFDELAVRVLVADASDVPADLVPDIAGVPVCVVEFPVEPLFAPDTTRYTEIPGGAQLQQAPGASGTLGAFATDSAGNTVALTCHHVAGDPGTTVWQSVATPAVVGTPQDLADAIGSTVAVVSPATQTFPVPAGTTLLLGRPVDAATISLDLLAGDRSVTGAIADVGVVDATKPPRVGMFVRKRGSQSGPTGGFISGLYLYVRWDVGTPPPGHQYVMSRQFEVFFDPGSCPDGVFSRGGDSGSVVLESGTQTAVGLLWGGRQLGGRRAMMCDITEVETRLGITLV
jgi:hypothetical protein